MAGLFSRRPGGKPAGGSDSRCLRVKRILGSRPVLHRAGVGVAGAVFGVGGHCQDSGRRMLRGGFAKFSIRWKRCHRGDSRPPKPPHHSPPCNSLVPSDSNTFPQFPTLRLLSVRDANARSFHRHFPPHRPPTTHGSTFFYSSAPARSVPINGDFRRPDDPFRAG